MNSQLANYHFTGEGKTVSIFSSSSNQMLRGRSFQHAICVCLLSVSITNGSQENSLFLAIKPDKGNLVILIAAGFCYLDNNKNKRNPNILNKNRSNYHDHNVPHL